MPIKIPDGLPAAELLVNENIFVMTEDRASHQDIRPLKVAILNLMPTKIATETQLIRLLSNSSLQVELSLLNTASHTPKHTPPEHMKAFYRSLDDVREEYFDGLIITGAPVEERPFESVDYWPEMCSIFDWADKHVYSTFCICWAAQAGLYYHYGVNKYPLEKKLSGIFEHRVLVPYNPIVRGFDELFMAPHSRNTEVRRCEICNIPSLDIISESDEAGVYLVADKNGRRFFVTGHSEYDRETLQNEYIRDVKKGINPEVPKHYFPNDDPTKVPHNVWRGHAHLLFSNWLNVVYQNTPYDLTQLENLAD